MRAARGWSASGGLLLSVTLLACANGGGDGLVLDGSARLPDDEGVATTLDRDGITLDDERRYDLSDDLASFSTSSLAAEPFVQRRGQYVQVGLDGDTVVWMAGFGALVPVEGTDVVFYSGTYDGVAEGRAAFTDGTTLAVAAGVQLPEPGRAVQVEIDAAQQRIVAVALLSP